MIVRWRRAHLFVTLLFAITNRQALGDCASDINLWDCDDGQCIDIDERCDGLVQCKDFSDEIAENCVQMECPSYSFRCSYGACIAGRDRCDQKAQCADGSDEFPLLCSKRKAELELELRGNCSTDEYKCRSGECIEDEYRCDGAADCRDGSDEIVEICSHRSCPSYAFRCGYGGCISGNAKCNNYNDCIDGSDEAAALCNKPRKRQGALVTPSTITTSSSTTTTAAPSRPQANGCLVPDNGDMAVKLQSGKTLEKGSSAKEGAIVRFECRPGYTLEGATGTYCQNSHWNDEWPQCIKYCDGSELTKSFSTHALCESSGRKVSCTDRVRPGTRADIRCLEEYSRRLGDSDKQTLKCMENGLWSRQVKTCSWKCGQVAPMTKQFIRNGENVNISQAPWHVSIYHKLDEVDYKPICGGTIISPHLVVSAVHCFWDKVHLELFDPKRYLVVAGKNFRDFNNALDRTTTQHRNIVDIRKEHFVGADNHYVNDIALLIVQPNFDFSLMVRPVCLQFVEHAKQWVNSDIDGIFTGWNEDRNSDALQAIDMRTVSFSACDDFLRKKDTTYVLPNDKFCLKNEYGGSACAGDSGGGFVAPRKGVHPKTYELYGVISHAPIPVAECARDGVVALTNVQYFEKLILKLLDSDQDGIELANDID